VLNSARLSYSHSPFLKEDQLEEPQNRFLFKVDKEDTLNYVHFFDSEDSFLKKLHSVVNTSPTTKSILQKKLFFTMGKGFFPISKSRSFIVTDEREMQEPNSAQVEEIDTFFQQINPKGQNIQDLLRKVIWDFDCFGNAYIEIIKTPVGLDVYHRPAHEVRLKEITNRLDPVQYCVISRDFDNYLTYSYEREVLPLYPNFENINGFERSVLHIKNYQAGFEYYGLPSWVSALLWCELEYRIPKYNQSEFENGFMPSAVIQVPGTENDEQAQAAVDMFTEEQTGTGNQSQLFAMLISDPDYPAKIDILSKQHEGSYMELSKLAESKIMQANNFSDALMGNKSPGELGGSQQLRTELEYKYEEMFIPRQNMFSKKLLQPLLDLLGQQKGYTNEVALKFVKNIPTSFAGDININEVLTVNERRQELGFLPLENNGE